MDHTDDTERALRSPPGGAIVDLTELVALLPRYGPAMNAFLQHHADAIAFCYSCFDRLLLHGYVRALQFGGSIVSFLRQRRGAKLVSPDYLRRLSGDYHVEPAWRRVDLYYSYLQDARLGRCFLRVCPYFPFDTQVCLNGHEWLAQQLRAEGIGFRKEGNALLACDDPT